MKEESVRMYLNVCIINLTVWFLRLKTKNKILGVESQDDSDQKERKKDTNY